MLLVQIKGIGSREKEGRRGRGCSKIGMDYHHDRLDTTLNYNKNGEENNTPYMDYIYYAVD